MRTVTLIAAADFSATCGPITAGEPIAEIHTDLELGELASLLRTRHLVHVESDERGPAPPPESTPPPEPVTPEPVSPQAVAGEPAGADGPADTEPLARLIDSKSAKLLAAEGISDVGQLRQWIAQGNRPEQLNGIGNVGEANILAATGLSLPQ